MKNRFSEILLIVGIAAFSMASSAVGQWSTDPTDNSAICTAAGGQTDPVMVSDGAGGAIIVWCDRRNGDLNSDIYAQRVGTDGSVLWSAGGVAVCTAAENQARPAAMSDGTGGAFITWDDFRGGQNNDVYAQRIDAGGIVKWSANGIAVSTADDFQQISQMTTDGEGGAIVVWEDYRRGSNTDIYAQRISADGAVLWTANGVPVCTASGAQYQPTIVSDGAKGAIMTWQDFRGGDTRDVYAQAIDGSGTTKWTVDGVPVCTESTDQRPANIVSDGDGGAIIVWEDRRNGPSDVYAQRVDQSGSVKWAANGVPVCTAQGFQRVPVSISDGTGGTIVIWADLRSNSSTTYAQRLNHEGSAMWSADGVSTCTANGDQSSRSIIGDGNGGAIIMWSDWRNGSNFDIYSQKLSAQGSVQWRSDGVPVCTVDGDQDNVAAVSDGEGGTIVSWEDGRNGGEADIYAQGIAATQVAVRQTTESVPTTYCLSQNYPNPFNPTTTIAFEVPHDGFVSLKVYDVLGREVGTLVNAVEKTGRHEVRFEAGDLTSGVYFYRIVAGSFSRAMKLMIVK